MSTPEPCVQCRRDTRCYVVRPGYHGKPMAVPTCPRCWDRNNQRAHERAKKGRRA